jgi:putative SOS response-associated peptidase YedK
MPCVLELEDVGAWMNASPDEAAALLRPAQDVLPAWLLGDQQREEQSARIVGVAA